MFDFDLNREELLATFLAEAAEDVVALEENVLDLERNPEDEAARADLLRRAHTLKGSASCVGLEAIAEFAHAFEDLLQRLGTGTTVVDPEVADLLLAGVDVLRRLLEPGTEDRLTDEERALAARLSGLAPGEPRTTATRSATPSPAAAAPTAGRSLRVAADKLNRMLDLVGEMAIARGQARQLLRGGERVDAEALLEIERHVDQIQGQLQELVMRARMVPLGATFRQFARTVRDLAAVHGKAARLVLSGEDVELDSSSVELLRDPLSHLVRNAVDHGIESIAARLAAGKPALATLTLEARHEAGAIAIRLADDGAGLDLAAIAARGRELGFDVERLGEGELKRLVFEPGFSTAAAVTELSGRGVGLDIVRRAVESLRGSVSLESRPGLGTCFTLRLPLTLAVIDSFGVVAGSETYLLPMESVLECRELPPGEPADRATGVLLLRDELVPWVRLRHLFGLAGEAPARENVVVVEHQGTIAGLVVDELVGTGQALIKPLGSYFPQVHGVAGSSILGNGRVALILDLAAILGGLAGLGVPALEHRPAPTLTEAS